jgi:hypothetical protein
LYFSKIAKSQVIEKLLLKLKGQDINAFSS